MARPANVIDQPPTRGFEDMLAEDLGAPLALRTANEITAEKTLFGEVITAQPCKVKRNEAQVLANIKTMAAAAGDRWYYRFPVWNKRKGRFDHIDGISIQGTDSVARYYGNCHVESVVEEHLRHWVIYSRFVDLETGYRLIRPFRQPKEQATLKSEDQARLEQIAFGIGVSKGQRIVVDHALKDFTTYAFEEAKNSIVEKIGKHLDQYRERTVEGLNKLGAGILARVELAYGRTASQWLAHDLAAIIAEMKQIAGGLESIDSTWPPPAPDEPRRSDEPTDVPPQPDPHAPSPAAEPSAEAPSTSAPATAAPTDPPGQGEPSPKNWTVGNVIGQQAIEKALLDMYAAAETAADLDAIDRQNAERIAKFSDAKRAQLRHARNNRRAEIEAGAKP